MLIVLCCVVIYASEMMHDIKLLDHVLEFILYTPVHLKKSPYDFIVESQYNRIAVRS